MKPSRFGGTNTNRRALPPALRNKPPHGRARHGDGDVHHQHHDKDRHDEVPQGLLRCRNYCESMHVISYMYIVCVSLSLSLCVCIYIYIYMTLSMYVCVYIYIYTHMIYIYIYIYTHTYRYMCIGITYITIHTQWPSAALRSRSRAP